MHPLRILAPLSLLLLAALEPAPGAGAGFALVTVPVGDSPRRLELADADADGDLDVLLALRDGLVPSLSVLHNQGGTTFVPVLQWTGPSGGVDFDSDLDLADLDADGDVDLLQRLNVLQGESRLNAGDGSFPAGQAVFPGGDVVELELGQLTSDALPDVAYHVIDLIGYVGVRKGDGAGGFSFNGDWPAGALTTYGLRGALGDVTGDGVQDFACASPNGLHVVRGQQVLTSTHWQLPPVLAAAGAFRDVVLADLDADGLLDAVASQPALDSVAVLLQQAGGLGAPQSFPAGPRPGALDVADLGQDGVPDVIVANERGGTLTWLAGTGGGGFSAPQSVKAGRRLVDVAAADLDGDGDVDLAAADAVRGAVVLLFSQLVP